MWLLFPKIYEQYLARQVYIVFTFILFALISLFIFFDYLNEVNAITGNYTNFLAFIHILLKAPGRLVEIIPVAGLIGAIYVFAQMASQSEFTILRLAGLNAPRGIWTLLKIGLPIIILTLALSEWVGPYCESVAEQLRARAIGSALGSSFKTGTWVKDKLTPVEGASPNETGIRFVNVSSIKNREEISGIRMYEFDAKRNLQTIRVAVSGSYDARGFWNLTNVTETHFKEVVNTNPLDTKYQALTVELAEQRLQSEVTPEILSVLLISPEKMSITTLNRFIDHLHENKQDAHNYEIALWKKIVYPLTILVMLSLALPFGYLNVRSGGISIKVFGGIMLGMSFQLFNTLFSHLGLLGAWPPLLTAMTPPLAYFLLGIFGLMWVANR
ncbi:MAG: LPS export ABC transporter permease LptG [Betaproteobacteria bacterium]|jgi:lipopolysaccharide export system permease protein